jgi:D-alanyl-lipoteichoic acid acyltransferase DltB (MBOAT superfamily)
MLFNSLFFLLVSLPVSWAAYAFVERAAPGSRVTFLVLLSLLFYGSFDLRFVPLLAGSILVNWLLAGAFASRLQQGWLIPMAIMVNLALLGTFKYLDFLAGILALLPGASVPRVLLALPLGISFFTFQQIMYLSDLRAGRTEHVRLLDYALYVAFFPRVIAGPLVEPRAFFPQLPTHGAPPVQAEWIARGLALLTLGLAKKVMIGDTIGSFVDPIYGRLTAGARPSIAEAWEATLGYTFQLYFDFSGYTDMALGLALLFGIVLPQNFDAPYRSNSIQDFWRRWHITLSFFLRDYLYIPFGGSRYGVPRQLLALFATMALGGLWHGAGWTFVVWGALHGVALGTHVLWRKAGLVMSNPAAWALTFAFIALTWVLFRAPTFSAAADVYAGLVGLTPAGLGSATSGFWPMVAGAAALAIVGPTAWEVAQRLEPVGWAAAALALLLAAILLKVGDDANFDFIYAQF